LSTGANHAGTSVTLTKQGTGTLTAGDVTAGSGDVTILSHGDSNLAALGAPSGAVNVTTGGKASISGLVSAAKPITFTVADLDLHGNAAIKTPAFLLKSNGVPAEIGDDPHNDLGFGATGPALALSKDEFNRVDTPDFTIDAGTSAMEIGDLAIADAAGSAKLTFITTGTIDVFGRVTGSPTLSRTVTFGGNAGTPPILAKSFRIWTTFDGGGRLIFGDSTTGLSATTLELRAEAIAAGQKNLMSGPGSLFPNDTALDASLAASNFVSQANSALYNSSQGGAPYSPAAAVFLQAGSLTLRYAKFALFQNTGPAGSESGVVIGGTTASPAAVTLDPVADPGGNTFAMFGTINGTGSEQAALLGPTVIFVGTDVSRPTSRVNGCVIGSASGGCLTSSVAQPSLNLFDSSRANVFGAADDLTTPLDPLVGANNEALFADVGSVASEDGNACPDGAAACAADPVQ
jgi:hypothetical protein